jgi:pimeloyl-ACP methyl ester carboxylesterase
VVLVHGLYLAGWVLALLAWRLRRRGFDTRLFSYRSVRDGFQHNSARLAEFLHAIDAPKVHVVAHSLGGLLALSVLAVEPTLRRGRLVLLGTPSQGSRVAGELMKSTFGTRIIGKCMPDANFHAPFLAPRGVETGVIAGTRAFGFGRLVTKLAVPNDGTVTVAETSVRGAAATTRVRVTHTALIFASSVADLAATFLRSGEFGSLRS